MNIGKLEEVALRELWKHEQYNFSDWLSKKENIDNLNEILGLNLTDILTETNVGGFQCDIFATDETSGMKVVIENQLEQSNHEHLGKLITYAAGLDAQVAVWIVKHAREEHRSAIEWLNNNTNEKINFFLLELRAYKIGDSLPAPQFVVIEQPNGFIKFNNSSNSISRSESERLEFWNKFNEKLIEAGKPFNSRKPSIRAWYDVALGIRSTHIAIELVNKESYIRVGLYSTNDRNLFDKLFESKQQIEEKLGMKLEWVREASDDVSRISYKIKGLNFDDHSNYDELIAKTIKLVIKMRDIFKNYINEQSN